MGERRLDSRMIGGSSFAGGGRGGVGEAKVYMALGYSLLNATSISRDGVHVGWKSGSLGEGDGDDDDDDDASGRPAMIFLTFDRVKCPCPISSSSTRALSGSFARCGGSASGRGDTCIVWS